MTKILKPVCLMVALALVLSLAGVLLPAGVVEAQPSEVWVDDDFDSLTPGWGTTHFDNIQDGIDAVADGGTVNVAVYDSGRGYDGFKVESRNDIDIVGKAGDVVVVAGIGYSGGANGDPYSVMAWIIDSTDIDIDNLVFDGIDWNSVVGMLEGIDYINSTGSITDVDVADVYGTVWGVGIGVFSGTGLTVDISGTLVSGSPVGIWVWGDAANIDECTVTSTRGDIGIFIMDGADVTMNRSKVSGFTYGVMVGATSGYEEDMGIEGEAPCQAKICCCYTDPDDYENCDGIVWGICDNVFGIWVDEDGNLTACGNTIAYNATGIYIDSDDNIVKGNDILNNTLAASGVHLSDNADGNDINYNNIDGNSPLGVGNDNTSETVDAENNWWGDASGPGDPGPGTGDSVSDYVDYTPWLTLEYGQVETATGTGIASVFCCNGAIEDLEAVAEDDLSSECAEDKPDAEFPHGFFSFKVTELEEGAEVTVTLTLPHVVPEGAEYWKCHDGGWVEIPVGSDDGDQVITITLTDGGLGDDDETADGTITDLGGPGIPPTGFTPSSVELTLDPGESADETKTATIGPAPFPKADIVFAFDLTGSMEDELAEAQAEAINIMTALNTLVPYSQYAVMSYMDYTQSYSSCGYSATYGSTAAGDYAYSLDQVLTDNMTAVSAAINGLSLGIGGDGPEDYTRIMYESYAELVGETNPTYGALGYRPGAKKLLINFADAIPHDCDLDEGVPGAVGLGSTGGDPGRDEVMGTADDLDLQEVLAAMASNGVTLLEIHSRGYALEYWEYWAGLTGGAVFDLGAPSGIPQAIYDLVEAEVSIIEVLTLDVEPDEYAGWVSWTPSRYTDVGANETKTFDVTYTVPEGTSSGDYEFTVNLVADSVVLASQTVVIHVIGVVADFTGEPRMGEAPHTVKFRDRSTGPVEEWQWGFGDGETSTSRNPAHTYQFEGVYTVTLTVSSDGAKDTEIKSDYIIVEAGAAPAELVVRNLYISAVHAQPKQEVQINAKVFNEGGMWGSDTVELLINAKFEQSVNVGVSPGTAQPISFTVYKVEAGEYQVRIGDATGTFYVMEEAAPPAPQKAGGLLAGGELDTGGIIAIIVIAIILIGGVVFVFLLTRRA